MENNLWVDSVPKREKRLPSRYRSSDMEPEAPARTLRKPKRQKKQSCEEYEVSALIAHRLDADSGLPSNLIDAYEFKVMWAGYDIADATWEPWENVKNLTIAIKYCRDYKLPLEESSVTEERKPCPFVIFSVDNKIVDMLRWFRNRRHSQEAVWHCEEETCYSVTFTNLFFPKLVSSLSYWHSLRGDTALFHVSCWCPKSAFTQFEMQCRSDGMNPKVRGGRLCFLVPAHRAPFHALGGASPQEIPFAGSTKPWFATAWKETQEVVMPGDDGAESIMDEIQMIRMVQGRVSVKWHPEKNRLDVRGNFCEAKYSQSQLNRNWSSLKGSFEDCDEIVKNVALNLAQGNEAE